MYQPKHFRETRAEPLQSLIASYPLATVIVNQESGLEINLLPMLLDAAAGQHGTLLGHVASGNPLAQLDGLPATVLFHGPDGYISPNWYPSKQQHGKAVPTWNFAVVQARGRIRTYRDPARLTALLTRLTDQFESSQATPWQVSDAPADFLAQMHKAIVGIDIVLDSLEGKFKLSQNRSPADFAGTLQGLRATGKAGDATLADWMAEADPARSAGQ